MINLYSNPTPSIKLKELVDKGIDIYQYCTKNKTPLLITDIYEVFPSLEDWNPDFLLKKVGKNVVDVNTSDNDVFQEYHRPIKMSLDLYSQEIDAEQTTSGRRLYMGAQGINQCFPELVSEIKFDSLLPQEKLDLNYLWYGPRGNTTGLHYDSADNFFMQLYGQKRWLLSSPKNFLHLYPHSSWSMYPRVSDFNPLRPDFEKFPKARAAQFYDITLNPGTALYVPSYWWHQVTSISKIISVNLWCDTPKIKLEWGCLQLVPTYLKTLLGIKTFPK
jgi:hypothetical protein